MLRHRFLLLLLVFYSSIADLAAADTLQQTIRTAQSKVVKVFGAGGLREMEAYQTGVLVSPEGHVLTALSYVLDTDEVTVILDDGRKWTAQFTGSDPLLELAVLKIPLKGEQVRFYDLKENRHAKPVPGQPILALSNLYGIATGDEPVSVLQGVITAVAPVAARRGAFQYNYRGEVYVLDAYSNNPGAAGGALVDWQGRLLGVLGKEFRSEVTGTWLNYAVPSHVVAGTVNDILAGRTPDNQGERILPREPHSAGTLGFSLVPNVLTRTPPYVDSVHRGSLAEKAGLKPDDLIVFVARAPVISCLAVAQELALHERSEAVIVSVLRDGNLFEFRLGHDPLPDDAPDELP